MRHHTKHNHLRPLWQSLRSQAGLGLLVGMFLLHACRPAGQDKQAAESATDATSAQAPASLSRALPNSSPSSTAEEGLRGDYVYFAEVATFQPCAGGKAMPIAPDSVALRLERRYLQEGPGGPAPMLVEIVADTVVAADPSGQRRAQLRVREILAIMPREHCP